MYVFSPSLNSIDEDDECKDYQGDEGYERRSPNLLQFTHSISAINSMSLGVQVTHSRPPSLAPSPRYLSRTPSQGSEGKKGFFESPGSATLDSRGLQETGRGEVGRILTLGNYQLSLCRPGG